MLAILLMAVSALPILGCNIHSSRTAKADPTSLQPVAGMDQALKVFDQYVERVRWSHYWHRNIRNDDVYVEGKQISALIFWTKTNTRPKWGLCSSDLSLCIANHSNPDWRGVAEVSVDRSFTLQAAFEWFANTNFGDGYVGFPPLKVTDFEFKEKPIVLPSLGLPFAILHRIVPQEARSQADRIRSQFVCWEIGTKKPHGCSGTQVFSYYSEADQSWYLLRSCSSACEPEFRGDAIEALSHRKEGWTVTIGGFTNAREDIEWFKPKILKAEMFRFEIP